MDGLQRYLADLAEKAAREWRFTPAKSREGASVASSKTLTFVFNP
jgi:outer membrane biosynthesis protein TonB